MILPKTYVPLLNLKGFTTWGFDEIHKIYHFCYRIKIRNNFLRLFLFIYRGKNEAIAEFALDIPDRGNKKILSLVETYKRVANEVISERDRIKRLFS